MTTPASKKGKKRALLAGGSLVIVAALATAAAFTDFANLNLGSNGEGIGGNNRFNIQVVGTNALGVPVPGTWQEANTEAGVDINVAGADVLTPGDTVSVDIPFRNESPVLTADIKVNLRDQPGKTSDAVMVNALRFTIEVTNAAGTVTTPLSAGTYTQAKTVLSLGDYTAAKEGKVRITITLPDQGSAAANNALNGKVAYIQAHFDATSK